MQVMDKSESDTIMKDLPDASNMLFYRLTPAPVWQTKFVLPL